jgi:hypothetical protein
MRWPCHKRGDRILLFEFNEGVVYMVEVVDTTEAPSSTPNGKYFTAFRQVANTHRRRMGRRMWQKLKASSSIVRKTDAQKERKLTRATFDRLCDILDC